MRLRAWHIAAAGYAAEVAFAAYAWFESPPQEALDVVTHTLVVVLLLAVGLLGLLPAALLAFPSTHTAGRWTALVLGVLATLSLFWSPQGVLLLAAFAWATWKERPVPHDTPA